MYILHSTVGLLIVFFCAFCVFTLLFVRICRHLEMYRSTHFSWAVRNALKAENMMNVYFEKHWEKPMGILRAELGLETPPYTPPRKNFDK